MKTKEEILRNKALESHMIFSDLEKSICYGAMEEYATQSKHVRCHDCNDSGIVQTGEEQGVPIYSSCGCMSLPAQSSDAVEFFKGQTPADFKNYIDRISMLSWDCDLNEALEEFSIFLKEKGAKG